MNRRAFAGTLAAYASLGPRAAGAQDRAGRWTDHPPAPTARAAVAVAAVERTIFVAGGYSDRGQRLLEAYDTVAERWRECAPVPFGMNYAAAAAAGGVLYVAGGFAETLGISPGNALGNFYRYDPAGDRWKEITPLPTPRGQLALVELAGKVHAVGGRSNTRDLPAHEAFDPASGDWDALAPLPQPLDQLVALRSGRDLHVLGGRTYSLSGNRSDHFIYDSATDAWRVAEPLPQPRSGHSGAVLAGQLVLAGGERPEGVFNSTIAYDPGRGRWTSLASMPRPRHAGGAAAVRGEMFFIGGGADLGIGNPTARNESFSFDR